MTMTTLMICIAGSGKAFKLNRRFTSLDDGVVIGVNLVMYAQQN